MSRVALLLALAQGACSTEQTFVAPDGGLERMLHQPRYDAFEQSPFFADGRVMQAPPAGTVPHGPALPAPELEHGYVGAAYVSTIPLRVDMALLQRGRERYQIFCAPCHGANGTSRTVVGRNMPIVQPRSLHDPRVRAYPPGRLYRVVNEGFGLMPGYAVQLSLEERWAVVAYVQALQLSRAVALEALPPDARRRAEEALR